MRKINSLIAISILALCLETGLASWYSSKEVCRNRKTCLTADGSDLRALEQKKESFGASWKPDLGTTVKVTSKRSGKSIRAVIRDRGPNRRLKNRIIDLGKSSFLVLSPLEKGLAEVDIEYEC